MATTKVQSELIVDDVALAGNPTTSTQSAGNNTTRIATTAFVTTAVNNLIDSAPGTMNTLNEIAAALNDDANFNTTVTNAIATKAPLASPALTGTVTAASHVQIAGNLDVVGQIGAYDNPGSSWGTMGLRATDYTFKNAGGTVKLTIDASGNATFAGAAMIGGTLHNEWHSDYIGLEIGHSGFVYNRTAGNELFASSNAYYDSGWKFAQSGRASMFDLQGGRIRGRTSNATGSQDGAITWVTALDVAADSGDITLNRASVTNTLTAGSIAVPTMGISVNQAFGTGVPTITMLGTAANGRAGAIHFTEQGDVSTAAIYSTDGGTGNTSYGGLTIATYQSDLRFATGGLASTKMLIDTSGRVGINRTPAIANAKLEVGGADNVPLINVEASGATAGVGIGSSRMKFYYGTAEKASIDSNGNLRTARQVIQENSDGTPRFINIPYSSAGSGFTFNWDDLANHSAVGDQSSETNAFMFEVNVTSYLFRRIKALIIVDTNADNSISVQTLHSSTLTCTATIPTNSEQITITIGGLWSNAVNYMGRITTF